VWNRFENVNADPSVWRSFHGIDRRRHTIHMTGRGFWIWWIHQSDDCTSVGVTWDKDQHSPDVSAADHGFGEMIRKFPPLPPLLDGARAKEPYQYYAHLAYRCDIWASANRYAILGDAGWFTDALYSIGLETSFRQAALLAPAILDDLAGRPRPAAWFDAQNEAFDYMCRAVAKLNAAKYAHIWHDPYRLAQTVLYETAEIGPLYHMNERARWTEEVQAKHYGLQWGSRARMDHLDRFLAESVADEGRTLWPRAPLLKKGLLPGPVVYAATFALWNVPSWNHHFFRLIRAWGYMERLAQRHRAWPDVLSRMAMGRGAMALDVLRSAVRIGGASAPPRTEDHAPDRASRPALGRRAGL